MWFLLCPFRNVENCEIFVDVFIRLCEWVRTCVSFFSHFVDTFVACPRFVQMCSRSDPLVDLPSPTQLYIREPHPPPVNPSDNLQLQHISICSLGFLYFIYILYFIEIEWWMWLPVNVARGAKNKHFYSTFAHKLFILSLFPSIRGFLVEDR